MDPTKLRAKGRKENFQGNCQGNAGPLASSGPLQASASQLALGTSNKTDICYVAVVWAQLWELAFGGSELCHQSISEITKW